MSSLRLLAVNHTSLVAGAERVLLRTLVGAQERGWSTKAAVPEGPLVSHLDRLGVERVVIPELMLPSGHRALAGATLATRTAVAARQIRAAAETVDVVVATGLRALPVLRVARPRAPVIWLAQSVVDRRRWRWMLRACQNTVAAAIAVSDAVATSIPSPPFPVHVVWNGTPWPVSAAPEPGLEPLVVGCASALTAWKGQDVLLEAIARLRHRDVVVELLGERFPKAEEFVAALRDRAGEPDLAGRVRFVGRVDDTLQYMRRWSVAVVPSVDPEAGPLTALEAMSVGVPVVATNHGGPREVIGEAGLLVPPKDPQALALAVDTLLADPERRRRCGAAGRRQVASHHRLEQQVSKSLDVIEAVVSAQRVV